MGKKTNNGFTVEDAEKYQPKGWGQSQKSTDNAPYEYTLESGDTVLIRSISMTDILKMGLLDKLDFFTASLSEDDKKSKPGEKPSGDFVKNLGKNFDKMEDTIDAVIIAGVVAPTIVPNIPQPNRKDGVIYADTIPFMDKMELFGELLDTEGLSDFRKKSEPSVGDVPADESLQDASQ